MVPGEPETYGISKGACPTTSAVVSGGSSTCCVRPTPASSCARPRKARPAGGLERDVLRLRNQWEQISALAAKSKSAKLLYQEPDLVLRLHP